MANAFAVSTTSFAANSSATRRFFRWLYQPACFPGPDHAGADVLHGHRPALSHAHDHDHLILKTICAMPEMQWLAILRPFHWMRMLTTKIGKVMTFQPLLHSLTVSLGATLIGFHHRRVAGLVSGPHRSTGS